MAEQGETEIWLDRLPLRVHPALALALTLALCAAAHVCRLAIFGMDSTNLPFVTHFLAVILACFLFGARFGLVAAAASIGLSAAFVLPGTLGQRLLGTLPFAITIGFNLLLFHWLQRLNDRRCGAEQRARALAETRELLFRELQHRVSNNLQVAAGLLSLQKKHVGDPAAAAALDEAARRVGVIGRISRQLYHADGRAQSLDGLLKPLCSDVADASGKAVEIRFLGSDDVTLTSDAAIPVALIVAEAVANAIEHGFADRDGGTIEIRCTRDAGRLTVEIQDDGRGLAQDFDPAGQANLGLRIVRMLAAQLDAGFELVDGRGATVRLVLPA